jgi:hypothetical protein
MSEKRPASQPSGLLPLSLLAKGEINIRIVRDVVEELHRHQLTDLMLLALIFGGWRLAGDELEWLKKEFANMIDLFDDSPIYQMM